MKIRLHGTEGECRDTLQLLGSVLQIQSVRGPYEDRQGGELDRSVLVRVYAEAGLAPPVHVASTTGTRSGGRRQALPPGGART